MTQFPPRLRKLTLTLHVTSSVGWLGAVAAFLALAVAGLTSSAPQTVRGAYLAMDVLGWYVIVPFSVACLLTGLVQSLGTVWGLLRHYWVITKLLITVAATVLLLVHMQPVGHLADAAAALLVLLTAVTLSVFKPRGVTRHGRRRRCEQNSPPR
ncbi:MULTISPECIES: hypothetical protein [unclassified Streptomyces]|uniref:hypothetical protein n=1 Tax=unclassified Streptomyces TaxID=2593676 RepID=UPI000DC7A832|nr:MULTISPECIES: hypothetical protein [unclassified Streptomyces]AWZ07367.1 hypothetical protein DRB89_25230 [Streptomyces sp. ICC4]AWZ14022.1 hypothetical protein DRB96_19005 [Streptomyces sp. ICC1]